MIDFFRYQIFDTFWSLQHVELRPDGYHQSVTLLRVGWFECIAAAMIFVPSVVEAIGGFFRS